MGEKIKTSTAAGLPRNVVEDIVRGMPKTESKTSAIEIIEIRIQGEVSIINKKANHSDSIKILEDEGLRPMTYQEALVIINQDSKLKEKLKGNWFYLEGKGFKDGGYYKFDSNGALSKGKGDPEQTVYAYSGPHPLSLYVGDDAGVVWRFDLDASNDPSLVAPVVVGVKK